MGFDWLKADVVSVYGVNYNNKSREMRDVHFTYHEIDTKDVSTSSRSQSGKTWGHSKHDYNAPLSQMTLIKIF